MAFSYIIKRTCTNSYRIIKFCESHDEDSVNSRHFVEGHYYEISEKKFEHHSFKPIGYTIEDIKEDGIPISERTYNTISRFYYSLYKNIERMSLLKTSKGYTGCTLTKYADEIDKIIDHIEIDCHEEWGHDRRIVLAEDFGELCFYDFDGEVQKHEDNYKEKFKEIENTEVIEFYQIDKLQFEIISSIFKTNIKDVYILFDFVYKDIINRH